MAARLLERGIYVIGFSFPVVPRGRRAFASSCRRRPYPQIDRAIEAFTAVGRELGCFRPPRDGSDTNDGPRRLAAPGTFVFPQRGRGGTRKKCRPFRRRGTKAPVEHLFPDSSTLNFRQPDR